MPRLYVIVIFYMPLFKNKYRIESIRLPKWDYASEGMYFVTVCTKHRSSFFGHIENGQMKFSALGQTAYDYWRQIPFHFDNAALDEFVVMPNHLHGIIVLENILKPVSLSVIIGSFKSAVTKMANHKFPHLRFAWLPRFHDHIIRDDKDLNRIRQYIQNNSLKWDIDKENPKNLPT